MPGTQRGCPRPRCAPATGRRGARIEPAGQRRHQRARVQRAGGRGREAADGMSLAPMGFSAHESTASASSRPDTNASSTRWPRHQSPHTPMPGFGVPQVALAQRLDGLGVAPALAVDMGGFGADAGDLGKGLEQLGLDTRSASSSRCLATRRRWPARSSARCGSRPGLLDSRASQAMRWCVLRAAFHCGPRVDRPGCMACGKASISVQQGATCDRARVA